jgi:putative DNA primase/helicase
LCAEWPGILAWMIKGCIEWQRQGLAAPEIVTKTTDEYLVTEDSFAAWMEEAGKRDERAWERTARLYGSWKSWAERSGEFVDTKTRFTHQFAARGFKHEKRVQAHA